MAFAEDLDLFFDTDEFAVSAVVVATEESFPVIFDRAHIEGLGAGGNIDATTPIMLARESDVAGFQVLPGVQLRVPGALTEGRWGSQQAWGGGPFTVRGIQPDGTGLTLLVLEAP